MKTWRETKIGKGIKRPKSKQMIGLNSNENVKGKIRKQKEIQRKLVKEVREEIKKANQFKISLEGLESLSDASICSIQTKREKAISKAAESLNKLLASIRTMKQIENQFRTTL